VKQIIIPPLEREREILKATAVLPGVGINNDVLLDVNAEQVASFLQPAGGGDIFAAGGLFNGIRATMSFQLPA
jgi:hypothetical protein